MKKILVVDDSATDRYFLAELLQKNGFAVLVAESAEEAETKLRLNLPDAILLDVVMPGRDGFQLARSLSKNSTTRDIPIILCTNRNQQSDRFWGLRQGARDYVTKPVRPEELLSKISALWQTDVS